MPKRWRYYEGTASANSILSDIATVLCTAVKDDVVTDSNGEVVKPPKTIPEANWDIVYPRPQKTAVELQNVANWEDLSVEEYMAKIKNQLSQTTDTIILKTTTTPVKVEGASVDDLGLENDLAVNSIDMYLELYKPKYMADPEKFHPETERMGIKPYNVTRSIYEDFASNIATSSLDLGKFDSAFGEVTKNSIQQDSSKYKDSQFYVSKLDYTIIGTDGAVGRIVSPFLADNSISRTNYYKEYYSPKAVIQVIPWSSWSTPLAMEKVVSDLADKQLNDYVALFNSLPDSSGLKSVNDIKNTYEKFKLILTPIKGSVYGYNSDADGVTTGSYRYHDYVIQIRIDVVAYTAIDQYKFTITSGDESTYHKIMLANPEKIKTDTMSFHVGENIQPKGDVWDYNTETGEFSIIISPSGTSWLDRLKNELPVLSYTYEKEQATITEKKLLYNNHYLYARIFDKIVEVDDFIDPNTNEIIPAYSGPVPNVIDPNTGELISINGHISEWSKLSWYQDFEEVLADELDSDVGDSDLSQGSVFLPIETPGLNGDTRMRFWVNTSNDRFSMVLMGNPSLDFSSNRHLTSLFYVGKIESFKNSINDTAGNFALMSSASTMPCATKTVKRRVSANTENILGRGNGEQAKFPLPYLSKGKFYDHEAQMAVAFVDSEGTKIEVGNSNYTLVFDDNNQGGDITFTVAPQIGLSILYRYSYYQDGTEQVQGIVRDIFGNILEIRYPETWGKNTATGVTDICMLHTRSKAYFQKHHMMFTTTEEYMTKEMYGKSAYTGEYYADRVKITHGNDGPRGMLEDVLVIDQSSLVALDELIVNRDFEKDTKKPQETYVFFPINAPFSPFSGSPNAQYGLAIKKAHIEPAPINDEEAVARVIDNLYIGKTSNVTEDLFLPTEDKNGVAIIWTTSDDGVIDITDPS